MSVEKRAWQVESLAAEALSDTELHELASLQAEVFPRAGRTAAGLVEQWRLQRQGGGASGERRLVVRDGGQIVANATVFPRRIQTSAGPMTVLALQAVASRPAYRGLGLGKAVVQAAFELVDGNGLPFALFQTSREVGPFYERLGAVTVDNRIVNTLAADPDACPFTNELIMRYPAGDGWPEGTIDLQGPGY